jgi:FixJ family two-component response regulator
VVAALQRGARHFIQKPVKPEVLYEVIRYVMGEELTPHEQVTVMMEAQP